LTLGTDQLEWFPWDEVSSRAPILGGKLTLPTLQGRGPSRALILGGRLTLPTLQGRGPSRALILGGRLTLPTIQRRGFSLGTDQPDWFPWDEALLEHRHLGQTNLTGSLGTRLFWSIDTWDRPT